VVWNVLDDVGNPVAMVRTDADITLFQVDRDAAWGVETDDLDVPYVVRYRLQRPNS
jgi:hypothetical protein